VRQFLCLSGLSKTCSWRLLDMRKLAYLAAISFLLCLSSSAQERTTTDVSLGYSYIRANPATPNSPDSTFTEARHPWPSIPAVGSALSETSAGTTWTDLIPVSEPTCSARESTCRASDVLRRSRRVFSARPTRRAGRFQRLRIAKLFGDGDRRRPRYSCH